jgi:hypothetical protein
MQHAEHRAAGAKVLVELQLARSRSGDRELAQFGIEAVGGRRIEAGDIEVQDVVLLEVVDEVRVGVQRSGLRQPGSGRADLRGGGAGREQLQQVAQVSRAQRQRRLRSSDASRAACSTST